MKKNHTPFFNALVGSALLRAWHELQDSKRSSAVNSAIFRSQGLPADNK